MRDWIWCRLKMTLLLLLFFTPVAVLQWHQYQLARLEAISRMEPIGIVFAGIDELSDADLP